MPHQIIPSSRRLLTREVKVGNVGIGGSNPIRIQSMTTTNTRDVEATVDQVMLLADHGCEIVRMTVQGMKEAESAELIKNTLVKKGYDVPLVADIHFYPPAALAVVEFVDKVRINPGNFADKRAQFKRVEYDDASYSEEIKKIEESFSPLIERCKALGKAIRIGTNHGSLSDRIMNRFGDSPKGMVESAFEFARIARSLDFHDMIFSMKASNPKVMIEAYRLLVKEMQTLGWDYPLHLGVTEAGQGEDGRIKSALGIGALLLEGIGDTIRVSLTEDPVCELIPAKRLVSLSERKARVKTSFSLPMIRDVVVPTKVHRYPAFALVSEKQILSPSFLNDIDARIEEGKLIRGNKTPDALFLENSLEDDRAKHLIDLFKKAEAPVYVMPSFKEYSSTTACIQKIGDSNAIVVNIHANIEEIAPLDPSFIFLFVSDVDIDLVRKFSASFASHSVNAPIVLIYKDSACLDDVIISASAQCGSLLSEGHIDGLCLDIEASLLEKIKLTFGIMQAARLRSVKTEFISCPGCGRTLFDLQEVSRRIEEKTSHLPGVKIAIMGCIVNGPGEMADADFGYVGSRPGKIDLYVGKDCVERNIEMSVADERLIDLIKSHGKWRDR